MNENTKKIAIGFIQRHEGLELKPYLCSAGKTTIGFGRNLEDIGISKDEAKCLLENDLNRTVKELEDSVTNFMMLNDVRQAVLIDMCYNLGISRFKGFKKMIDSVEAENYKEAAKHMLGSRWATQVGERATELSEAMNNGFVVE
ncbi:MAG TPA: lysozyme [Sulfurimonas sp. UBA12504]|nr:MAG TPA: lysozyme [Sulfurimonas sp. UBA12504]